MAETEERSRGLKEKKGREAIRRNIRGAMSHEAIEGILFLMAYIVVKREVVSRDANGCSLAARFLSSVGVRAVPPWLSGTRALGQREIFGKSAA
jgi:hypothetical protein